MKKLTILLTMIILLGCSKNEPTTEEPQVQDPTAVIADNVVVISDATSELISTESELASGTYKIQFNQAAPAIKVDDIIVGDIGLGFLRKVTTITTSNNVVTMQTTQADMEDVFGNTSINFNTDLSDFNRASSDKISEKLNYEEFAPGVSRRSDFLFNFADVVVNSNASANLKITNGSLTFNPNYEFDFDYSLFSLDRFHFSTSNTQLNAEVTFNVNANAATTIPVTEYTLYQNSKTFVRLVGTIPLVVTVYLKLKAQSSLSAGGNLNVTKKVQHNTSLELGGTYENGSWTPIAELNAGFVQHPVDLNGSYFNLTESISIVPEVVIAFYGINGPKIDPTLSANFGGNLGVNQDWDAYLNARIDLNVGASIGIFGKTLITYPYDSYNFYTQPLWNAPNAIEISSGNNQTGTQGEPLANPLKVRVSDNTGLAYLKNVPVYFAVTAGNGTVTNQQVLTDVNGYAQVNWTLGNNTDPQTVEAYIKKADGTRISSADVEFTATTSSPFALLTAKTWVIANDNIETGGFTCGSPTQSFVSTLQNAVLNFTEVSGNLSYSITLSGTLVAFDASATPCGVYSEGSTSYAASINNAAELLPNLYLGGQPTGAYPYFIQPFDCTIVSLTATQLVLSSPFYSGNLVFTGQ